MFSGHHIQGRLGGVAARGRDKRARLPPASVSPKAPREQDVPKSNARGCATTSKAYRTLRAWRSGGLWAVAPGPAELASSAEGVSWTLPLGVIALLTHGHALPTLSKRSPWGPGRSRRRPWEPASLSLMVQLAAVAWASAVTHGLGPPSLPPTGEAPSLGEPRAGSVLCGPSSPTPLTVSPTGKRFHCSCSLTALLFPPCNEKSSSGSHRGLLPWGYLLQSQRTSQACELSGSPAPPGRLSNNLTPTSCVG